MARCGCAQLGLRLSCGCSITQAFNGHASTTPANPCWQCMLDGHAQAITGAQLQPMHASTTTCACCCVLLHASLSAPLLLHAAVQLLAPQRAAALRAGYCSHCPQQHVVGSRPHSCRSSSTRINVQPLWSLMHSRQHVWRCAGLGHKSHTVHSIHLPDLPVLCLGIIVQGMWKHMLTCVSEQPLDAQSVERSSCA